MPLVELDDVCLTKAGAPILDHVTAAIPDHGVTVVLGASGSGKSTLLRLVNRLEVPTQGTVRFRGDDVAGLDPLQLRRRVGMVFQRPTPFPGTVRDNLLVARPTASDPDLAALLDRCGLPREFLDRATTGLSGGEAQRVCLARALAAEPEALLLDEPTASLDPENRATVERLALDLAARGLPMVWVTHDLAQADRLARSHAETTPGSHTHQIVLVEGRVAAPEQVAAFRRAGHHPLAEPADPAEPPPSEPNGPAGLPHSEPLAGPVGLPHSEPADPAEEPP